MGEQDEEQQDGGALKQKLAINKSTKRWVIILRFSRARRSENASGFFRFDARTICCFKKFLFDKINSERNEERCRIWKQERRLSV